MTKTIKELNAELSEAWAAARDRAWAEARAAEAEVSRIEAKIAELELLKADDAAASAAYHAVYHPSTASWAYANAELELSNYLKEQDK